MKDVHTLDGRAAYKLCKSEGGMMLTVDDEEQNNFFTGKLLLGDQQVMPIGCIISESDEEWQCPGKDIDTWFWKNATSHAGYWSRSAPQSKNAISTF